MDDQKQLIDKLQSAANILVTVSSNPSVDQLAACIGLTIALNKLDKHATAVFSGDVPDTIEFLKPEDTLEKNTDSLRDFIIALDKAKADKLRYKVEDRVVKIFITPYRTSISSDDLDFSQGDFNVDLVVALGVHEQQDLDQAITSHGRILHDATVVTVNNTTNGNLGSINWTDTQASSLSELVAGLLKQFGKKLLDEQISTALLTGIVAATDRFRNDNTSAQTMSVSADLMAAGANQQLVTSQLEHRLEVHQSDQPSDKPSPEGNGDTPAETAPPKKSNDGTLEIDHKVAKAADEPSGTAFDESKFLEPELPKPVEPTPPQPAEEPEVPEIHGVRGHPDESQEPSPDEQDDIQRMAMKEPPAFGGPLTANQKSESESYEPSMDPLSAPASDNAPVLLSHNKAKDAATPPPKTPDLRPAEPQPAHLDVPSAHDVPPMQPPAATATSPLPTPTEPLPPALPSSPPPMPPVASTPSPTPPPSPTSSRPAQPATRPPEQEIDVEAARSEVMRALSEQADEALPPIAALNAQPLGGSLHDDMSPPASEPPAPHPTMTPGPSVAPPLPPQPPTGAPAPQSPADQPLDMPLPPSSSLNVPPPQTTPPTNAPGTSPNAPPPVPPPMLPPNWPPKQ